ncbi:hypothetical protein [Streptomyces fradiae]|uniref:hypothetical protein n=1 Tax=Streptomyces fradiae TaxID=1906 RepID=UPI00369790C2
MGVRLPRHRRTARRAVRLLVPAALAAPALLAAVAAPAPAVAAPARVAPAVIAAGEEHAEATCRTVTEGSRVTAYCHNPYPRTDRVSLHVECARWWDVDADSAPVEVPPTAYVELTERCWKEVAAAWISHDPAPAPAPEAP